jgi:serine/threonine protein kinase
MMAERYRLIRERGRGAIGVVWRAEDTESGESVALKLLRPMYLEDADVLDPIASCQASRPQRGSKSCPLRHTPQTRLRALRMQ